MWQWSLWETDRLDRQITTYANHTTALPEAQRDKSIAGAGRVAHALLGPPGSEEGPRDAGGPGANGLPASE
jgi:hypothetical protein